MSLETEFSEILTELTKFRSAIGRVQAGMRSTQEREVLGDLLGQMDQARVDAESAVPEAIKRIHRNESVSRLFD